MKHYRNPHIFYQNFSYNSKVERYKDFHVI